MSTIRLTLRTDKPDKNNRCSIELIYQLAGQRKYYHTRQKLLPENWDSDLQQALYLDKKKAKVMLPDTDFDTLPSLKEIQEINNNLADLRKQIADTEKLFELSKTPYSAVMVLEQIKKTNQPAIKTESSPDELTGFIDKYIEEHRATRVPGSLTIYRTLKKHLLEFQRDKKRKVTFENIDYAFFQDFQSFLVTPRKVFVPSKSPEKEGSWKMFSLTNTTAAKQLSTVKTFLNYARVRGVAVSDKFRDFKIKRESLEVIALTQAEFDRIFSLKLGKNRKLEQVRDVFCFSCVTGLRYSDLQQLKREHIKEDEISLTVRKTKEPLIIPLNAYSRFILKKYKNYYRPLPVISNQKTNAYMKELGKLAGIDDPVEIVRFRGAVREANTYPKYELVSVHTGRKTFATLSLEKGMSAEEVMEIGGWKDYKSFKRYVRITEQRKKLVMQNAWGDGELSIGEITKKKTKKKS